VDGKLQVLQGGNHKVLVGGNLLALLDHLKSLAAGNKVETVEVDGNRLPHGDFVYSSKLNCPATSGLRQLDLALHR